LVVAAVKIIFGGVAMALVVVTIVLLAVDDADEAVDRCLRFPLCVLICLFKWSERENGFWQILQLNGLIPVCDRTCLANSSDLNLIKIK